MSDEWLGNLPTGLPHLVRFELKKIIDKQVAAIAQVRDATTEQARQLAMQGVARLERRKQELLRAHNAQDREGRYLQKQLEEHGYEQG